MEMKLETIGQSLIRGANEALSIAKGEMMPAVAWFIEPECAVSSTKVQNVPADIYRDEEEK
ncbi:hypothetical protein [Ruegeria sp. A3M17]|uniref:hypothetical protein n=1 Tax=Ruegeria sp. A3M17 TaxID=2267229 RepID=UPI001F3A96EE|nr:hypothetical protein [Ruegeria sp. A3M17]